MDKLDFLITNQNNYDNLFVKDDLSFYKTEDNIYLGDKQLNSKLMKGASKELDGEEGNVPKPKINDRNKFLRGDGTWSSIASSGAIDSELDDESENPLQNKIITNELKLKGDSLFYDTDEQELQLKSGDNIISSINLETGSGGGIKLTPPTNISLTNADESVILKWTDPEDIEIGGAIQAKWDGTLIIRKLGSPPISRTDGVIVLDSKIKNSYKEIGFTDKNLTNNKEYFYGFFPYTTNKVYNYDFIKNITPEPIYPDAPISSSVKPGNSTITVTFELPGNATGAKIAYSTQQPESTATPYGMVISGVESPYTIAGLTNDIPYYVTVYSTNVKGRDTAGDTIEAMPKKTIIYGYRIKKAETDPYIRVEYTDDAIGMVPAKVNGTTGEFDYGSWRDVWFVKENKPCMIRYDGTIDYYLDQNDDTKKEDGTASDVANTSYEGNAMALFPTCWVKRWQDDTYEYFQVSNVQVDSGFKAYAHQREDGSIMDWFARSIYDGSTVDNRARSISGLSPINSTSIAMQITRAQANGSLWGCDTWSRIALIWDLLKLISKSCDCQTAFGYGRTSGATDASEKGMVILTGTANTKGQFYGTYSNNVVKVFHIENLWGNVWKITQGLNVDASLRYRVRMTKPYSNDGNGYDTLEFILPNLSWGFQDTFNMSEYGLLPLTYKGSSTTYVPDAVRIAKNSPLCVGGACNWDIVAKAGFAMLLGTSLNDTNWGLCAALTCEQPK